MARVFRAYQVRRSLVQADLVFRLLEAFLDRQPGAGCVGEVDQAGAAGP
jgi:hypothetical protein